MRKEDEERLEERDEWLEDCYSVNCMEVCEFCPNELTCRKSGRN